MSRSLILISLFVAGMIGAAFAGQSYAESLPEDQLTCKVQRDMLFSTGEMVTTRRCRWSLFEVSNQIIRNDEALFLGRCHDTLYYLNKPGEFPKDCDWIMRTPAPEPHGYIYADQSEAVDASTRFRERTCISRVPDGWVTQPC